MDINVNKLFELSNTATFRQSMITTTAVVINGILGAIFFIFVARLLGPADFGLFTIAVATTALIADIADFGTNTGIIRFVPKYLIESPVSAYKLLKLSLEVKALVWIVILVGGYFLSSFLAVFLFEKPELTLPLQLSFFGVGGAMLFSFTQAALQAFQKYKTWSAVNIVSNVTRLIVFGILVFVSLGSITNSLLVYIVLPFFGFLLGLCFLPTYKITLVKNEFKMLKDFKSFNLSVGFFTIIAAISGRVDMYIGARLLNPQELGIYGAAVQLNSFILQIIGAIGVVVAPKFASFDTLSKMKAYFKKFQIMVVLLAFALLLGSPLSFIVFPWFYGPGFEQLPVVFILYLVGMLIYLIAVPVQTVIFYYYSKPQIFIYIALIHLILLFILATNFTNIWGIFGLTLAVVGGMVFNFVIPLFYVINRFRKDNHG